MIRKLEDAQVSNKRVFLRVDLNLTRDLKGRIVDDFRMRAILPTLKYLIAGEAKVIIISHFGSPGGRPDKKLTLRPIARRLSKYLGRQIIFVPEVVGPKVAKAAAALKPGEAIMLENLRFDAREEENASTLTKQLAKLADIYVNDAFGAAHRNHASIVGLPRVLPAYIGPLFEKEIQVLGSIRTNPRRPFVILMGGIKLATKLPILKYFKDRADTILIGGALANNFFVAKGLKVGRSFFEPPLVGDAKKLLASRNIVLPQDLVISPDKMGKGRSRIAAVGNIENYEYIYDFGSETIKDFTLRIKKAKTILWNGPLGFDEMVKFRASTDAVAKTIAHAKGTSMVGGGDTVMVLKRLGLLSKFDHVSTGGGAMLEYLGKGTLVGLEALNK